MVDHAFFYIGLSSVISVLHFFRLADVMFDHVFASPFHRTMETASIILAQNSKAKRILIKPETAFMEVFYFL